jgi:hypothetical protein
MTERKTAGRLDFEALRLGIERCDPDLILGFYAEDADLSIVNADDPQRSPFDLSGRAEIAKHLRATFGPESSHRVEREVVGEDRVTFWETCEYLDGSRLWVETTLEVRDGKIVRQVDVVATAERIGRKEKGGQTQRLKQATEKEDLR